MADWNCSARLHCEPKLCNRNGEKGMIRWLFLIKRSTRKSSPQMKLTDVVSAVGSIAVGKGSAIIAESVIARRFALTNWEMGYHWWLALSEFSTSSPNNSNFKLHKVVHLVYVERQLPIWYPCQIPWAFVWWSATFVYLLRPLPFHFRLNTFLTILYTAKVASSLAASWTPEDYEVPSWSEWRQYKIYLLTIL